jgi:hypothetical protein
MTFITHGFRVSVVSDVRDFRLTFALYVKKIFISWVFRYASIHGRAGFILFVSFYLICERQRALYGIKCVLRIFWQTWHLKIIWQCHAHAVHQKVSRFFGPRYIVDDFFLGPNLVSFNRAANKKKICTL